jgi:hypothetical protein
LAPKRRPKSKPGVRSGKKAPSGGAGSGLRVRRSADGRAWELVLSRAARDRREDLEEVYKMIEAGETEIAIDELRWLLNGCSDFLDAHRLLGELALADNDLPLARAHLGYAHRLGMKALGARESLPCRLPANQAFHEAGKALVGCLMKIGKHDMAREVLEDLLRCDPSDPLAVRALVLGPSGSDGLVNITPPARPVPRDD